MMKWSKLLCTECYKRPHGKPPPEFSLNEFKHDQDLILFSQPFRRLQAKTQVHPLSDNDHVRTRLTHSIEVGMIGYVLGWKVGKELIRKHKLKNIRNDDIGNLVQAACLAHDIGNPSFGHTGEEAIKDWFSNYFKVNIRVKSQLSIAQRKDFELFDGNAQGFRIVTHTENYKNDGGMRLTYATLATLMKYPCSSEESINRWKEGKFSYFDSEKIIADEIAHKTGMLKAKNGGWKRHPLAFLVEAADDICYRVADLEDGIQMGSFNFKEFKKLFKPFINRSDIRKKEFKEFKGNKDSEISYMRSKAITDLANQVTTVFLKHESEILKGNFKKNLLDFIDDINFVKKTKIIASDLIFKHEKKLFMEVAAYEIIGGLLHAYTDACLTKASEQTQKNRHLIDLMGTCAPKARFDTYTKLLYVLDYVSGMTDKYAIGMYRQIQGITTPGSTPATIIK
jgi:dGTPase